MPFFLSPIVAKYQQKKQMFFDFKKIFFNTAEEKSKRHNKIENTSHSMNDSA